MDNELKIGDKVMFDCTQSVLVFEPKTRTTFEKDKRSIGSLLGEVIKTREGGFGIITPGQGSPHGIYLNFNGWHKRLEI